jgi:hypothetical protein
VSDILADRRNRLIAIAGALNLDECEALLVFAEKLWAGRLKHGELNLATDARDFRRERLAERLDEAFYLVFENIQAKRNQEHSAQTIAALAELTEVAP